MRRRASANAERAQLRVPLLNLHILALLFIHYSTSRPVPSQPTAMPTTKEKIIYYTPATFYLTTLGVPPPHQAKYLGSSKT